MGIERIGADKPLIRRTLSGTATVQPLAGKLQIPLLAEEAITQIAPEILTDLAEDETSDFRGALDSAIGQVAPQFVYHGANPNVARPGTSATVVWVGTVPPSNRVSGDIWWVPEVLEPTITWLAAYSAADLALASGSPVASWAGHGAVGPTLVQATSGFQPTYQMSGSLPVVRFDGVDDRMGASLGSTYSQPGTVAALVKVNITGSSASGTIVTGTSTGWTVTVNGTTKKAILDAGTALQTSVLSTGDLWRVVVATVNGTNSTIRVNGQVLAIGAAGANTLSGLRVGSNSGQTANWFAGDIAQLRVANRVLTGSEINQVEEWLAGLAGVSLGSV